MCALRNPESEIASPSCVSTDVDTSNRLLTTLRNLPNLQDQNWYSHNCFNGYWSNYKSAFAWYRKHCAVYREIYGRPTTLTSVRTYSHSNVPPTVKHNSKRWKRKERRKMKERQNSSSTMEIDNEEKPRTSSVSQVDDINMDISDEMLDFFAKSHKHRKQRDADKQVELEQIKLDKRVNIEQAKSQQRERTVEAPIERPGMRRSTEMKVLYGKGAPVIHGMETALQMTYDRSFDNKQPKYWPNMPFKCVFPDK